MKETSVRRLNDQQLREAELLIDDPLAVDGLSHYPPDLSYPPVIIAEYHLARGNEVRCCHCEQRQLHQNGFVAEFSPTSRHLIGSACGQEKLGLQFSSAKSTHKDLRSRQSYLSRLDFFQVVFDQAISHCDLVLQSDELRKVESVTIFLNKYAGDLMFRLRANDGELIEVVEVRDLAAETKQDEESGRRRFKSERRRIGQLEGRAIIQSDNFRLRIKNLKDALRDACSLVRRGTDGLNTRALQSAVKRVDLAYANASNAVQEINQASAFFKEGNLEMLEKWARQHTAVKVRAQGSTLVVNGRPITLERFKPLTEIMSIKP